MIMEKFYCRICGYRLCFEPWGDDGKTPTYEICPCCGVEFGNEDCTMKSIKEYRGSWIKSGCKWFEQSKRAQRGHGRISKDISPKSLDIFFGNAPNQELSPKE